jgi:hypothetical protein
MLFCLRFSRNDNYVNRKTRITKLQLKNIDNDTLTLYLLCQYNMSQALPMEQDIKIRLNNIYHCKLKELATVVRQVF